MNIQEPNLADVITTVGSTNIPHMVQIGSEMAPSLQMVVKYNGFVTFFSDLFSFFAVSSVSPHVALRSELHA